MEIIILFVFMGIIGIMIYIGGNMFGWDTEIKKSDVKILFRVVYRNILDFLKATYNMETHRPLQ